MGCEQCGGTVKHGRKFCSKRCAALRQHSKAPRAADEVRHCAVCGVILVRKPGRPQPKRFCSHKCRGNARGEIAANWRGGRLKTSGGYALIAPPVGYTSDRSDGYVLEHRFVMEEHLGRPLTPDETVHHKNGSKDDNRLENLELWSSRHPKGQRVEDLLEFAREILHLYS